METIILEIKFPEQLTYFIAYTDYDVYASGIVDVDQEMTTGQPFLYQTTVEAEWIEELKKFDAPAEEPTTEEPTA
jgi:hypothetical protein